MLVEDQTLKNIDNSEMPMVQSSDDDISDIDITPFMPMMDDG